MAGSSFGILRRWLVRPRASNGEVVAPEVTTHRDSEEIARDFAVTLLTEARDELTRADQKASILLAGTTVAIGAVVSGMIASGWRPDELTPPWSLVWQAGGALGLAGTSALVAAVYPRTRHGVDDEAQLFYFGHAARIATVSDLARELRRSSEDTFTRSADQLWRISRVVTTKYRFVRAAIWLLAVATILTLSGSILGSSH